ncbi:MAG TPA: class I SAM-dependent methyltransferase [Mycobacteriales bacterium]
MADWDGALYEKVNALQQWLAARSLSGLQLRGDERLLDVGCGDGQVTAVLAERLPTGSVLGIDASPRMVETAREHAVAGGRLQFDAGDVLTMPFVAEFDVIVSFNVLHWVRDQRRAFGRIGVALRPGGWALLQFVCGGARPSLETSAMQVCRAPRWRSWFDDFPPPFVHPAPDDVRAVADAAGFQISELAVDDLTWDFGTPTDFARWCRVGFSAWMSRLPDDATADAFVDDVAAAYGQVTGSRQLFRFRQLRTVLRQE